jgi:hypothetical protein
MEKINLRQEYVFDKQKIESLLKETYDYCRLPMKNIIYCTDVEDERFARATRAAKATEVAEAACEKGAARATCEKGVAGVARAAWATLATREAGVARAAKAACEKGVAGVTGTDYEFDYFAIEKEYLMTNKGNDNDKKALFLYEKLFEMRKAGLGYIAEDNNNFYLVPAPIVQFKDGWFHSTTKPSIKWKNGLEVYMLKGIKFSKELWEKIVQNKLSAEEVFAIENTEERRVAYEMMDKNKLKALNPLVINKVIDGKGKKMELIEIQGKDEKLKYLHCIDASTDREYFLAVQKEDIKTAEQAKLATFGLTDVKWINEW